MKKSIIALLLAGSVAVSLTVPAVVYADEAQETETEAGAFAMAVSSVSIENGVMTIYVESEEKDPDWWWEFSREDAEDSCVEVITDSTDEGYAYVGSFKAVDGCENKEETLRMIHTDGFCTDWYMDFQVTIEDGKITTLAGGTSTPSTPASEIAKALSGTWQERSEGKTMLDISLGKNGGLDMVMSDGSGRDGKSSFYTMTAYYDAVMRALVYNNGTFHEGVAITDGSQEQTESDTQQGSGIGTMEVIFSEDGATVEQINWTNQDGGVAVFVRTPES